MNKSPKTEAVKTAPPPPQTKRYPEEFKRQAVENRIKTGKPGTRIAAELGVSYPSLKDWKRRYYGDATPQRDDLVAENRALKAELARVREQRDILKKNGGHFHRTVEGRYQTIKHMKAEHSLSALCAAFDVTRSGYHAWAKTGPGPREQADAQLLPKIRAVHQEHRGRYGAPRIQQELAAQGSRHGGKRIARLMKAAGLRGLCARRYVPRTTDSRQGQPIAPNLLGERPAPTGPDQTWVTDLTYVPTEEGWPYVAVILDLWSRKVVGWATAATLHAALAIDALRMALQQRRPPRGLLHHSDRGVQYASGDYRALLAAAGLEASMSRQGNPYDNAAMESFNATYKHECVGLAEAAGGYATRAEATADCFLYVETYYNRVRRHSALGSRSPVDFERQLN